jgi:hypothetical protein
MTGLEYKYIFFKKQLFGSGGSGLCGYQSRRSALTHQDRPGSGQKRVFWYVN